mmetsp:Transcript_67944/g.167802  ORF Transcript_67944/g.167802 Transcript_67944/m.167802 type:complete len:208 (+) Transcript_67944:114-737(+)
MLRRGLWGKCSVVHPQGTNAASRAAHHSTTPNGKVCTKTLYTKNTAHKKHCTQKQQRHDSRCTKKARSELNNIRLATHGLHCEQQRREHTKKEGTPCNQQGNSCKYDGLVGRTCSRNERALVLHRVRRLVLQRSTQDREPACDLLKVHRDQGRVAPRADLLPISAHGVAGPDCVARRHIRRPEHVRGLAVGPVVDCADRCHHARHAL